MIGPWERIEASSRDDELDSGVEARIADPLWMLARQWQVGEFRGDDAASPVATQLNWRSYQLDSFQSGPKGPIIPMPQSSPLEQIVESAPFPTSGAARLYWSGRLSTQITRRLKRGGMDRALNGLRQEFPLLDDVALAMPGAGVAAINLLRKRAIDGMELLEADDVRTIDALSALNSQDQKIADDIIVAWRIDTRSRYSISQANTWDETRLEHNFSVASKGTLEETVLSASQFTGGHLDWYSFDIDSKSKHSGDQSDGTKAVKLQTITTIPTPVRYSGMPAPRWWAFEDGDAHFGDIASAPGDLGRLLLADYATIYSDDWYSIPLRLPLGTLTRIESIHVHDTMGGSTVIPAAALADKRKAGGRVFRLYELHGDPSVKMKKAPLLFLPPSLAGSDLGPPLERVELVRDEAANLAWGIERLIEGPTGRALDRMQHWRTSTASDERSITDQVIEKESDESRASWKYQLEATAPPFWIPFLPVRKGARAQVQLHRSRMQQWELLTQDLVGVHGELLQPHQPMIVEEEEIPRGGITLERRWQIARWTDGSLRTWMQRSKRPGYGERSSGVRWDILEEELNKDGKDKSTS